MRVEVYRNLHRSCWSVRDTKTGLVVDHVDAISLIDAQLVVRPAGREKVLREGRKNVHAFIRGTVDGQAVQSQTVEITYNPYRYDSFVVKGTEEPIKTAESVTLTETGKAYTGEENAS